MASATFAGTTICNDAAASSFLLAGPIMDSYSGGEVRWAFEQVTRGDGEIAKDMGTQCQYVAIYFKLYLVQSTGLASFRTAMLALIRTVGTLVTPRLSLSSCILIAAPVTQYERTVLDGSTLRDVYATQLLFKRLRNS